MFKFTFEFTLTILLEVMTWISLQFCARVAPGSCPRVGLGVQRAGAFVCFGHMSRFTITNDHSTFHGKMYFAFWIS